MKFTVKSFNDTGTDKWTDTHKLFATSEEEAKDILLTRWLMGIHYPCAEYVNLYLGSKFIIQYS